MMNTEKYIGKYRARGEKKQGNTSLLGVADYHKNNISEPLRKAVYV